MQKEENKYQNMVDPPIQLESPFESPKIQQIDLNDFNKELDWIDIVYSIKTLNRQVAYLLKRDQAYSKAAHDTFSFKPDLYKRNLILNNNEVIHKTSKVGVAQSENNRNAQIIDPSPISYIPQNPMVRSRRIDANRPNTYMVPEEQEQVQMVKRNPYHRNIY